MRKLIDYLKLLACGMMLPVIAFAEEAAHGGAGPYTAPAAGLGIAIAVFAASTAQGRIASSYMEGVSRNPGAVGVMKTQLLLSLIFVETLVLFTLLIALNLAGKV
jgi:F-type H+-transporting ATPase subunit c